MVLSMSNRVHEAFKEDLGLNVFFDDKRGFYVRVGNEPLEEVSQVTTTSNAEGWSLSQEPHIWTHTAQELMDKYYHTDKISRALGFTHYAKKGKLFKNEI